MICPDCGAYVSAEPIRVTLLDIDARLRAALGGIRKGEDGVQAAREHLRAARKLTEELRATL